MIVGLLDDRAPCPSLPGRLLLPLAGAPLIVRQIERVGRARRLDRMILLVGDGPHADQVEALARREGVKVAKGAPDLSGVDHLVHMPSGLPLVDPDAIDASLDAHLASETTKGPTGEVAFRVMRCEPSVPIASAPPPGAGGPWAIETPADYALAAAVYEALHALKPHFTSRDVMAFLSGRPDLSGIGR